LSTGVAWFLIRLIGIITNLAYYHRFSASFVSPADNTSGDGKLVGMVSLRDLLRARTRNLDEERARERVLRLWTPFGRQARERMIPFTRDSDFQNEAKPIERR